MADIAAGRLCIVHTVPAQSKEDALRAILEVARRSDIESVLPCYRMGSENLSMITDSIAVVIDSSVSEGAVLGMFVQDGLQLAERFEYADLGKIAYRLKLSAYTRQVTGESCLAIANRYHEHPLIEQAAPVFRPLYKTMNASTTTSDDPAFRYDFLLIDDDDPFSEQNDNDLRWFWDDLLLRDGWDEVYGAGMGAIAEASDYDGYPRIVVAMLDNGAALNYTYGNVTSEAGEPTPTDNYKLGTLFPTDLRGHPDLVDGDHSADSDGQAISGPRNTQWINEEEATGTPGVDDDLNGYVDDYYGWDFVGSDPLVDGDGDNIPFPDVYANLFTPLRTHGTTTMSIISAVANNNRGAVGYFPTIQHMPVRFHVNLWETPPTQSGSSTDMLTAGYLDRAINYASGFVEAPLTNPSTRAHVMITMAGLEHYDPLVHLAIKQARINGVLVVTGHGGQDISHDARPRFPSSLPEVLATGASEFGPNKTTRNKLNRRANYSAIDRWQKGLFPDDMGPVIDPGFASGYGWALDVMSIIVQRDGPIKAKFNDKGPFAYEYKSATGTSGATPQPAGIAGLMLTVNPLLSPMELQVIIQKTAKDLIYDPSLFPEDERTDYPDNAPEGRDQFTGWGLMQAGPAVVRAKLFKPQWVVRDDNRAIWELDENKLPTETKTKPRRSLWSADPTDGDVIFDGWVIQESTTLTDASSGPEVLFKVGTTVKARLDLGAHELHLAGVIVEDEAPASMTNALFRLLKPGTTDVAGIIDTSGNLKGIAKVFEINTIDDTPDHIKICDGCTQAELQTLIDNAATGDVIEIAPGTYQLTGGPIDFGGKNITLRSFDPYDRSIVSMTKIIAAPNQRAIVFDGTETEDAAVIGLTIMGDGTSNSGGILSLLPGTLNGAKARILNNVFISNATTGNGGAINNLDGLIEGNKFGNLGEGNSAVRGGALYDCDGIIVRNVIFYNEALGDGGGLDSCQGTIQSNFIGLNVADSNDNGTGNGGALASCNGDIRSNIIWGNLAVEGGGLYGCGITGVDESIIEQNTIYANHATSSTGVGGIFDCDTQSGKNRNNILWANTEGTETSPTQIALSTLPRFSVIDQSVDPNPNNSNRGPFHVLGPFTTEDVGFVTTDLNPNTGTKPSHNWDTFLHVGSGSVCIDNGEGLLFGSTYRDIDNQMGPITTNSNPDPLEDFREIGADEFPNDGTGSGNPWWYQL